MPRAPAVSVIVCFLNEAKFLAEAVHSIAGQTFGDWELWLVDDGSSDGSSEIARQLAATDPERMTCIEHAGHANLGLSASRNAGIAHARGRYIALLDADDVWAPNKLAEQTAILDRHADVAMVMGASLHWRSWSAASKGGDMVVPIGAANDAVIAPPQLMTTLYPLGTGAAPPPSTLMLRSDVVRQVGGFEASFRGPLMLYEDQAFLSKIYRGHPVYVASACWVRYRQRAESIVSINTAAGRYWQVRLHFLRWLEQDLARSGPVLPAVQAALSQAIRQARRKSALVPLASAAKRLLPPAVYERLRRWC
jgi:glycosyltransferase involved in cell wall biosynthesis